MWRNEPPKAIANGEPSYEGTHQVGFAGGWWQGHEAWANLCAGGTMGVVYGAGSLWQWRLHADEPDHSEYFLAPGAGWREALDFEGSRYVGLLGKILGGLPTTDMEPAWAVALAHRALIVPDKLFLTYASNGGIVLIPRDAPIPMHYRLIDPRTGKVLEEGTRELHGHVTLPSDGPVLYICTVED